MKKNSYWNSYYKKIELLNIKPSSFSKFCYNKFIKTTKKKDILDIGCGNGRDTIFFFKKGLKVVGIDKSATVIKINKNKFFSKKNLFLLLNLILNKLIITTLIYVFII